MKTKTTLISLAAIILIIGTILFVRSKTKLEANPADVVRFLNKFNTSIKQGNADTVLNYFQAKNKTRTFNRLADLLLDKKGPNGETPPADIALDVNKAVIKTTPDGMTLAVIPVTFSRDSVSSKRSILTLKIFEITEDQYKIIQVDSRRFLNDYANYTRYITKLQSKR